MLLCRCSHAWHSCFWNIPTPLWVGVLSDWVWFPPQTSTLVCVGKKPHQSISPLRCGPLMAQSQVPLQDTTSGIQYYFQIFPDFTELNSAKVMFHFSLRKTYQINIKSGTTQDCSKCSENQFFIILHQPEFFQNFWNFSCMCCIFTCYNSC